MTSQASHQRSTYDAGKYTSSSLPPCTTPDEPIRRARPALCPDARGSRLAPASNTRGQNLFLLHPHSDGRDRWSSQWWSGPRAMEWRHVFSTGVRGGERWARGGVALGIVLAACELGMGDGRMGEHRVGTVDWLIKLLRLQGLTLFD
ncbi:hypothetical protein Hypma_002224 [Hypsizygus marmoreus]|uniref:Uncharacterized protein n=1 Tax=Hypsizygus marmoreus TaxID=39966 RepID=A0A369K280_HYPMA|nr:hypothetical protein Hypma_002224 [Hypsizygus marmoreus]